VISITKDVLRTLFAARGKLDTDSGKVFAGFVGAPSATDKLWHGDLQFDDPGDTPPKDTVSIKTITLPARPTA